MDQKTAQQQFREQYQVAENFVQGALRVWNDLAWSTTDLSFDAAEKSLRFGQELRGQFERNTQDALSTYRRVYTEGLKSVQNYSQSVSEIISRSTSL